MAAEVSSLARILRGYVEEKREAESDRTRELVTRDFLGGGGGGGGFGAGGGVKELDLDLAAPAGWERRLDLMSGEVFLQPSGLATATATAGVVSKQMDRNPPPLLPLFPSPSLDPGLLTPAPAEYQSVCTLDKVKSALDRLASAAPANKAAHANRSDSSSVSVSRSRSSGSWSESLCHSGSPASSSTSASSMQGRQHQKRQHSREGGESGTTTDEDGGGEGGGAAMFATGCPSCLSYVLITRNRPRCPRCSAHVPSPATKKPRLDLNLHSSSSAAAVDGTGAPHDRS